MELTRANFGSWTFPSVHTADEVSVYLGERHAGTGHWILGEVLRRPAAGSWSYTPPPVQRGPFDVADFGNRDRLAWPVAACEIRQHLELGYWDERYATWMDGGTLTIVDATRSTVLRLRIPHLLDSATQVLAHGGRLWMSGSHGVIWCALPAFAALFDRPPGALEVHVAETYPVRHPGRVAAARVEEIGETEVRARTLDSLRSIRFPVIAGLALGMEITLYDELWHDFFLEVALPGQPRHALYSKVLTERTFEAQLEHLPAIDPAGTLVIAGEAPSRQADIDRLLRELASSPDDHATRSVLVDVLEEAGEPYAPLLAELVGGETGDAKRREALGPLANYLDVVSYRGGLPWRATLLATSPLDEAIGDAVAADQRIGLFHTLRLGDGPFGIYAKLVGSPRAVGLRRVDAPNRQILAALITGNRRDLTHLSSVKFATREVNEQLADATFDQVAVLETETAAAFVAKLLEFIIRDEREFFARSPRHLILTERNSADEALVAPVLAAWDRLPLTRLTVAGVTLSRDGTADAIANVSPSTLQQLAGRFRVSRV